MRGHIDHEPRTRACAGSTPPGLPSGFLPHHPGQRSGFVVLFLQREGVLLRNPQVDKYRDALAKHAAGVGEHVAALRFRSLDAGGIGNAPMRRHRLARPYRTRFLRRAIANREDEARVRCAFPGEFLPGFGAE